MNQWLREFLLYNWGTKTISVFIAVVLWFVVLGSRNVEVTKEVPVEIVTSEKVVVANELPETINFKLYGPKAFLRTVLNRRESPIRVNLETSKPGLVTYRFFSDNIRLPIGVKVLSINPTAILVKLEKVAEKELPVRITMQGKPAEGYRIARTEVEPAVVKVKGARSVLKRLKDAPTSPVDVGALNRNLEERVRLDLPSYGVELITPNPSVRIFTEPISANFRIRNVKVKVLSKLKFKLSRKAVTVFVRANPVDLKELDQTQVYGQIDLRGRPKGRYRRSIQVIAPKNIGVVKATPSQVTVTLF